MSSLFSTNYHPSMFFRHFSKVAATPQQEKTGNQRILSLFNPQIQALHLIQTAIEEMRKMKVNLPAMTTIDYKWKRAISDG